MNTIEFDVNFLNMEDPEVFDRLTGSDYEQQWKAAYGFDYVTKLDQYKMVGNLKVFEVDDSPLTKHCAESESR